MFLRSIALFVLGFVVPCHLLAKASTNNPTSWSELTTEAKEQYTPVLLMLHDGEDKLVKKIKSKTWENEKFTNWLGDKFLKWSIDKNEPGVGEEKIIAKFQATDQPMILIFHPTGYLMGRVDGFVDAQTLTTILDRHLKRTFIFSTRPALTLAHAPESSFSFSSTFDLALKYGKSRGEDTKLSFYKSVEGFEAFALDKNFLAGNGQESFGLLLFQSASSKNISRKINKTKKFWRGNIWVFQLKEEDEKVQTFVSIGPFQTEDQAETYAKALHKFQGLKAGLFSFSQFLED
ncbi:MAG: hypothetical protein MRZ79_11150 [Bacteroidia bacterium]|nr:hypothetical protein [Bacteroidia bacterium]